MPPADDAVFDAAGIAKFARAVGRKLMFSNARRVVLGCLALVPLSAWSVPITVDFTVRSTSGFDGNENFNTTSYAGFPSGTVGGGFFTYDDSVGAFVDHAVGRPLIDFNFTWMGATFDESVGRLGSLAVDVAGNPTTWLLGTVGGPCAPINCFATGVTSPTDFWISAFSSGPQGSLAALHRTGFAGYMGGSVTWAVRAMSVPEPGSIALLSIGLLGF